MARGIRKGSIWEWVSMFGVIRSCVTSWPKLTAILTGGIIMIDVTNIAIPSEYLVALVITALVMGVLVGYYLTLWLHEKAADSKVESGKIASTSDLQYDKRYVAGSVVGTIFGMLIGCFGTPIIVQNCIIGGGVYSYIAVCIALTAVAVVVCLFLIHWGLRLSLVRAKDYIYTVKEETDSLSKELTGEQKAMVNTLLQSLGIKGRV